ncbi:MAG TPA: hypothetical protein DEP57_10190 [Selenomonas sp.]|nr:hypothetical protein [Selenomonas sp.]
MTVSIGEPFQMVSVPSPFPYQNTSAPFPPTSTSFPPEPPQREAVPEPPLMMLAAALPAKMLLLPVHSLVSIWLTVFTKDVPCWLSSQTSPLIFPFATRVVKSSE